MEAANARRITLNIGNINDKINFLFKHLKRIKEFSAQIRLIHKLFNEMGRNPQSFNDPQEVQTLINYIEGLKNLMDNLGSSLEQYISHIFDSTVDQYEKRKIAKGASKKELIDERIGLIYEHMNSSIANLKVIKEIILSVPEEKRDYPKVG